MRVYGVCLNICACIDVSICVLKLSLYKQAFYSWVLILLAWRSKTLKGSQVRHFTNAGKFQFWLYTLQNLDSKKKKFSFTSFSKFERKKFTWNNIKGNLYLDIEFDKIFLFQQLCSFCIDIFLFDGDIDEALSASVVSVGFQEWSFISHLVYSRFVFKAFFSHYFSK